MALPKTSPWGKVQQWTNLAEGIDFASTAGHGGIKLSRARQARMPDALKMEGGWYEEDVEYNRVYLAFPDAFKPEQVAAAHKTIKDYHPDVYTAWSGEEVKPEESHVLREKLFKEANKDNYIVLSAYGSWHEKVPKGWVGVFAGKGGRMENGNYPPDCKYFLVPEDEYQKRGGNFVVDIARHQEIEPLK